MSYGYKGSNVPTYGYQTTGRRPINPYYRPATIKNSAGLFGNGLIQGESKADSPFTNLVSTGATTVGPKRPVASASPQDAYGTIQRPGDIPAGSTESTPSTLGGGADPSQQTNLYDYRTDPILQEIMAMSRNSREDAESGSLAAKKRLAIQYGDANLANSIGDTATADAANANSYSVFGRLKQQYDANAHNFDESENKGNLFYSGDRIVGQQQLGTNYGGQVADATAAEQDALGAVEQNRLATILGANSADINAKREATQRAIDAAVAAGYTFGGYDGNGNPILTPPDGSGGAVTTPQDSQPGFNAPLTEGDPLAWALGQAHRRRNAQDLLLEG